MLKGQRIAAASIAISASFAAAKISVGLIGHSTAVFADGLESTSDVLSSGFVLLGLTLAARPADENHPYGHGRIEILTGLLIGLILTAGGGLISFGSYERLGTPHEPLATFVVWPLVASLCLKVAMAAYKFHYGHKTGSAAIAADAWHDATDSISAATALTAVSLELVNPVRFVDADRYGGFLVGLIVVFAGLRVAYETAMQLMDTMPDDNMMTQIREAASTVPGVRGVEKCFARKTGMRYHVDLHLEVDPELTVRQSHLLGHLVREEVLRRLDWVADVLVHVEPAR